MNGPAVTVTGATGAVGGAVARMLAAQGVDQRLLVRDPSRVPDLPGATVTSFTGYADPECATALTGTEVLFLVSGAESADRLDQHRAVIDAAVTAGVRQIVYTSFLGAAADATFTLGRDHWATEEYLGAAGIGFTALRDNFYLDIFPHFVGDDGVLRGPGGGGRVSAVARADVAACAAAILIDPTAHLGARYDVTGPEALSLAEIADTIGSVTGREITYHDETLDEAYASRARWRAPSWQVDAWVSTYTSIAAGQLSAISGDVERLIGRPPLTLREVLAG